MSEGIAALALLQQRAVLKAEALARQTAPTTDETDVSLGIAHHATSAARPSAPSPQRSCRLGKIAVGMRVRFDQPACARSKRAQCELSPLTSSHRSPRAASASNAPAVSDCEWAVRFTQLAPLYTRWLALSTHVCLRTAPTLPHPSSAPPATRESRSGLAADARWWRLRRRARRCTSWAPSRG